MECTDCSFRFSAVAPDTEMLRFIYDEVIDTAAVGQANFSLESLATRLSYLSTILRLMPESKKQVKILDFGCGFGPTLHLLKSLPNILAIGFETSEARLTELSRAGIYATGDIIEIGRSGPFDVIIMDNVLEHVARPAGVLDLIRQWCNPITILYISVPDGNSPYMKRQKEAVLRGEMASMDINPWEHLSYFDIEHLDRTLRIAGFRPLKQSELRESVSIGLRPSALLMDRVKNSLACLLRLGRFSATGDACPTVTRRFYRQIS